jgi:hypothetical protein
MDHNASVIHVSTTEDCSVALLRADDGRGNICFVSCSALTDTEFGKSLAKLKPAQLAKFTLSWEEPT